MQKLLQITLKIQCAAFELGAEEGINMAQAIEYVSGE